MTATKWGTKEWTAKRAAGLRRYWARKHCRHLWDLRIPCLGGAGHYRKCSKCGRMKKAWGLYEGGPRKRSDSVEPQLDPAAR